MHCKNVASKKKITIALQKCSVAENKPKIKINQKLSSYLKLPQSTFVSNP